MSAVSAKALAKIETYADTEIWSISYRAWKRYEVKKPRLPQPSDDSVRLVDSARNRPATFSQFIGKHNDEAIKSLRRLCELFENTKQIPSVVVVQGVSGSGKSALVHVFLQQLCETMNVAESKMGKFALKVDAHDFLPPNSFETLWREIRKFGEAPVDRAVGSSWKLVVIDNIDSIPSAAQFAMRKLMEAAPKLKFVLVVCDKMKIAASVLEKANNVVTKGACERDALLVVATILHANKIGFDREGLRAIFGRFSEHYSISEILDLAQQIFRETHFVSEENAMKVLKLRPQRVGVSATAAAEPLERCTLCTLYPPCDHTTYEQLCKQASDTRAALPRYKGGMSCPEWQRYGHCSLFSRHGHCSCDHPKDLHRVAPPELRCKLCTILWPCNHCPYSKARHRLVDLCRRVLKKLDLLRVVTVPDAPYNLVGSFDAIDPLWRDLCISLEAIYGKKEKVALVKEHLSWTEVSRSYNAYDYQDRTAQVQRSFGEVIKSPFARLREETDRDRELEEVNRFQTLFD